MKNVLKNRLCLFLILAIALTLCPKVDGMAKDTVGLKPVETSSLKAAEGDYTIDDTTVTISSGVEKLSYNLFDYKDTSKFEKVTKLVIPSSVSELDEYYTFSNFPNLKEFEVDSENKYFRSSGKLLVDSNNVLRGVPTNIGSNLVVPDDVVDVSQCYSYSKKIKTVTLGAGVKTISSKSNPYGFLTNFFKLKEIKVSPNNKYYTAKSGVLYSKDMKKLITYPQKKKGTSYTIGSKVTTVGYAAFLGSNLTKITAPKTVNKVEGKAFAVYTSKGVKVYFKGKAPKSIEKRAFDSIYKLTIYYPKKYKKSWAKITKKKYGAYSISWKAK